MLGTVIEKSDVEFLEVGELFVVSPFPTGIQSLRHGVTFPPSEAIDLVEGMVAGNGPYCPTLRVGAASHRVGMGRGRTPLRDTRGDRRTRGVPKRGGELRVAQRGSRTGGAVEARGRCRGREFLGRGAGSLRAGHAVVRTLGARRFRLQLVPGDPGQRRGKWPDSCGRALSLCVVTEPDLQPEPEVAGRRLHCICGSAAARRVGLPGVSRWRRQPRGCHRCGLLVHAGRQRHG